MTHTVVAAHAASWTFVTDRTNMIIRGCTICGEVEVVVIDHEQRAAARVAARPGVRPEVNDG